MLNEIDPQLLVGVAIPGQENKTGDGSTEKAAEIFNALFAEIQDERESAFAVEQPITEIINESLVPPDLEETILPEPLALEETEQIIDHDDDEDEINSHDLSPLLWLAAESYVPPTPFQPQINTEIASNDTESPEFLEEAINSASMLPENSVASLKSQKNTAVPLHFTDDSKELVEAEQVINSKETHDWILPSASQEIKAKEDGDDFFIKLEGNDIPVSANTDNALIDALLSETKPMVMAPVSEPQTLDTNVRTEKLSLDMPVFNLDMALDAPDWTERFQQQVIWLGQQKIDVAQLQLNPPELGPLMVKIKIDEDAASLNFSSHTPQVREIIEQSLPRLREMMFDQGISLTHVNIEDSSRQQRQQSAPYLIEERTVEDPFAEIENVEVKNTSLKPTGMIDYFA